MTTDKKKIWIGSDDMEKWSQFLSHFVHVTYIALYESGIIVVEFQLVTDTH